MKLLYLDIFAGISGDMFIGALLDLGVSERVLRQGLSKLHLHGYALSIRRQERQGISGTKFDVHLDGPSVLGHRHAQHGFHKHSRGEHRSFTNIRRLIEESSLDKAVKESSISIFRRIAQAEGKIHGVALNRVQFHEVGAVDSIVDIIGAALLMHQLGADCVCAREIEEGTGFIDIQHGRFPIPAPAMLEILRGVRVKQCDEPHEMITPTGAAILAEFVEFFGPMPSAKIDRIGYGLGTRELQSRPNVLRAVLAQSDMPKPGSANVISVIETNIDDMNPQWFGDVMDKLIQAGALDVFYTPVQMKKNRPGTLLTVLGETEATERLIALVLEHTTTFGVRVTEARREILEREKRTLKTRFGVIEIKIGRWNGRVISASPEYESCRKAAARQGVPLKVVYTEALKRSRF